MVIRDKNRQKHVMKKINTTYLILLSHLIGDLQQKVVEQTDSPLSSLYANIPAKINQYLCKQYTKSLFPLVYEEKAIEVNEHYCGWLKQFSKSYRLNKDHSFDLNRIYLTSIRGNKYLTFEPINKSSKRVNAVSCVELLDLLERKDNIIQEVKDYVNQYVQSIPNKDSSNDKINDLDINPRKDIEETEKEQITAFDEVSTPDSLTEDDFDNMLQGLVAIDSQIDDNKSMKFTSMQDIINNLKAPSVSVITQRTEEEIEIQRQNDFKKDLSKIYGNFVLEEKPFDYGDITRYANY